MYDRFFIHISNLPFKYIILHWFRSLPEIDWMVHWMVLITIQDAVLNVLKEVLLQENIHMPKYLTSQWSSSSDTFGFKLIRMAQETTK